MKRSKNYYFSIICLSLIVSFTDVFAANVTNANRSWEVSDEVAKQKWSEFKYKYNRRYGGGEDNSRYNAFKRNLAKIEELNSKNKDMNGDTPFGINQFSDLTPVEFSNTYLNFRHGISDAQIETVGPSILGAVGKKSVPANVDWRQQGAVSAVKNQGQCGSCWAFTVTEELETAIFLSTGQLPLLSVQQVNSCSTSDSGCNGGDPVSAYEYLVSQGVQLESSYPYTSGSSGQTGSCNYNSSAVVGHLTGYRFAIPSCGDSEDLSCSNQAAQEASIQQQIATSGPASVCIVASTWQYYTGGVIAPANCSSDWNSMNHCAQLVGYGTPSSGSPYWLVRNQWGTDWGVQGYIQLQMGGNTCGIANEVTYVKGASYLNGPSPAPVPTASPSSLPSPIPSPSPVPSSVPTPVPTFNPNQTYQIINGMNQACMSLSSSGRSSRVSTLYLTQCTGSLMQKYQLIQNADTSYMITNASSGLCLSVYRASVYNGASLVGSECNGSTNQNFDLKTNLDGTYEIVAKNSGKCLDISSAYSSGSIPVIQSDCTGGTDQVFMVQ